MKYSVEANEIAGFIHFFGDVAPKREMDWIKRYPELGKTDYQKLIGLMRANKHKIAPDGIRLTDNYLYAGIEQMKTVDELKKRILAYSGNDIDKNRMNQMIDSVWPVFHSFYPQNASELNQSAKTAQEFMNQNATKPLEAIAHFYNYELPSDYTVKSYMIPTVDDQSGQLKRGGQNINKGQMEMIWFTESYLKTNPEPPYWMILHESTHALFNKSGSWDKSFDYLTDDNPLVQCFRNNPELKRTPQQSDKDAAHWILNEGLTTAFQGIFEEDVLHHHRKTLYANPVIDTMAHRMMPILRESIKTGETFGPEFMKKFEREFMDAVPEMLKLTDKSKGLISRVTNGSKENSVALATATRGKDVH